MHLLMQQNMENKDTRVTEVVLQLKGRRKKRKMEGRGEGR